MIELLNLYKIILIEQFLRQFLRIFLSNLMNNLKDLNMVSLINEKYEIIINNKLKFKFCI